MKKVGITNVTVIFIKFIDFLELLVSIYGYVSSNRVKMNVFQVTFKFYKSII